IFDGCAVPIEVPDHKHEWSLTRVQKEGTTKDDLSKVVAKCTQDRCKYVDEDGKPEEFTISISAADKEFDGEACAAELDIPEDLPDEIKIGTINYYKVLYYNDGPRAEGPFEVAPAAMGEYYAVVDVEAENGTETPNPRCTLETEHFFITKEITDDNIEIEMSENPVYDGKSHSVKDKVRLFFSDGDDKKYYLLENVDYEFDPDSQNSGTDAGTYTVKVKGKKPVTGEASITWKIKPATNSFTTDPAIDGWTYGDKAKAPVGISTYGTPVFKYADSAEGDFTTDVPVKAGTHYMIAMVTPDNNYAGLISDPIEFEIVKKDVIVTPVSSQMKYVGQEDPEFLYDVDGLLEGDTLSGKLGRQEGETEGTYEFNIGTLKDDIGNYNVMLSDDEDVPFFQIIFQPLAGISATIDKDTFDKAGQTAQITVTFDPEDASDKEVKYESTNTSVAKVDATGKVTAVADGTSTIVVTSNDSGYTAEIKVTVRTMGEKIDGEGTISGDGKILIDEDGTEYKIANKVDKNDLKSGMMVADKASGGKYKITGLTKKGGKIVNATVEFVKPYNSKTKVVTIKPSVKIGGVTFEITSIAANTFKGNVNITKLTIGKNITTIGKNACNGATKLKTIIFKSTKVKKIGANAFKNIYKKAKFKLTKKRFKKYRKMVKKAKAPKKAKYTK
nr:Ig-like domain-containing protein [Eubacterium sp.]